MTYKGNRDISLDWIGGLLLIHMILLHISQWAEVDYILIDVLFFFMPWFFFKAGMFHRVNPEKEVAKASFNRLLIPFIVFSLIGQIVQSVWMALDGIINPIKYISFIKQIFVVGSISGNLPLWFLLSLFLCKVIFNWMKLQNINTYIITTIFLVISIALHFWHNSGILPLYVHNTCLAMVFYSLGYALRNLKLPIWAITVLGLGLIACAYCCHSVIDFRFNRLLNGYYLVALPYNLAAILFINSILRLIPSSILALLGLHHIGSNTMGYYTIHWIIIIICDIICVQILGISHGRAYWWIVVISCAFTLPLISAAIKKYYPRAIGIRTT